MLEEELTKQIWSEASRVTQAEVAVLREQLAVANRQIDTLNALITSMKGT
jgi:hypothetical protein